MDTLLFDDVRKNFGELRAVDGLSLRIPSGCVYGLLGPNGAGKTTSIRMATNILSPDSGTIRLFNSLSVRQARDRMGYMPEERGLYPRMKIGRVLTYLAQLKGVPSGEIQPRIDHWLRRLDLDARMDRPVQELSRGMQRRLEFIATVISDPDLVILDEPFAGLDPMNLDLIKDIVREMRNAGKTIVLSTHLMEQAETLCDSIVLIDHGRKVLEGAVDEVKSRYEADAVVVELIGDTSFISSLPMVSDVRANGKKMDISFRAKGDDQRILQALVGRVQIRSFAVKVPSLHEIFVRVVGGNHGQ